MKASFDDLESAIGANLHPSQPHFHVVLLYEDYESGWHAMHVYERLVKTNCRNCLADWNRWRFTDLLQPEARESAIESLQAADMVIVAAPETTELTVEAQAALETGLGLDRKHDRAFVMLLGIHSGGKQKSAPLHFYLPDVAMRNGFTLFQGTFLLPEHDSYSVQSIQNRTGGTALDAILSRPIPRHWGINE